MTALVADVDPGSPFCRQGSQASYPIVERTTETARRACSSRAMRCLHAQARPDTELCIKCTNSFQISGTERCLPRSLTQETGSVSSRVALPRLPRVEEGPHPRVSQLCGRADQLTTLLPMFFGKVVLPRVFGKVFPPRGFRTVVLPTCFGNVVLPKTLGPLSAQPTSQPANLAGLTARLASLPA